ncbi:MAG: hypothetical protein AB8B55_21820 [Mariniblastus sp.]
MSSPKMVFATLWKDDSGFIITMEIILIATITVLGLIVGLTAVRDALVAELSDVAEAIEESNLFSDSAAADPPPAAADTCIDYSVPPTDET